MIRTRAIQVIAVALSAALILSGVAVASHGTVSDAGTPDDIEAGDETQAIDGLTIDLDEPGADNVDVYINVTALETANIDLDSLNVNVGTVDGADLVDQDVTQDETTVVRLTFDAAEDADSITVESVTLDQLATSEAVDTSGLTYDVAHSDEERVGDEAPDSSDAQTAPFDVIGATDDTDEEDDSDEMDDGDDADEETDDADEIDDTDDETDDADDADDDGAGFGVIAALGALLAAAFIARRR